MAAPGSYGWRPRGPIMHSNSYDPYYSRSEGDPLPPASAYSGGNSSYYGTPRSGGGPPPSSHHQHSPIVTRGSGDADYFYNESPHSRPMSPTHGGPPSHSYERYPPSFSPAPYRSSRPAQPHRSQVIHRGTPPYSSRGASASAAATPRAHPAQRYGESSRHGPPGFFPESPYSSRSRNPPVGRMVMPLHRQHLPPLPRNAGPAPWEPPSPGETQKKSREESHQEEDYGSTTASRDDVEDGGDETETDDDEKDGGDPLALLAKVSSDMENKPGQKSKKQSSGTKPVAGAPPTSPLTRRTRSSPVITPTTDNTSTKRKAEVSIHPSFPEVPPPPRTSGNPPMPHSAKGPKAVTPMPPYYPPYGEELPRGPPPHHYSGPPPSRNAPGYRPYPPPPHHAPSWHRSDSDLGLHHHPAVVERHSFDSIDSGGSHDSSLPPPPRRFYGPPPSSSGQAPYGAHPAADWPPGSPRRQRAALPVMSGPPPPYPSRHMYPPSHHRPSDPYGMSPYSFVQQPDEKTVLRRKFSWKHYPELERFLIANRDDYLEHSSKNYTAEQKQYNNWLTERLLQVAEQYNYVFDPDDFNFVAIRDRIRCYYKSYVQTARKRGLELPGKAHIKKHRPANSLDKYAEEKKQKEQREKEGQSGGDAEEEKASSGKDKSSSAPSKREDGGSSTDAKQVKAESERD
eukprot:CAMPEP_0172452116 /NCGR_PEP_ID=MMETSP1065-20121228/9874_1 /TAXON_ID=265537 /ORGANISM="Amphiprora paludosa, Strain CCMP125" /LENGTH=680 /DNA_ID=CAMNT_0013204119 /DNA_START=207 /DNA_END=2249 /DNA_ORIENTATION=-